MKNLDTPLTPSKMNALKSGYFAIMSEDDPVYQNILAELMQTINKDNAEQVKTVESLAYWRLKQHQLSDAMEQYQKKWIYKQRTAKDLAHKATNGMAPILEKPDLSMLFEIAAEDSDTRIERIGARKTGMELSMKMRILRGNYALMISDFVMGIKTHKPAYDPKDIMMCHKTSRQAIAFTNMDINYYQNQWVYAEYHEEILAYLENLPQVPDTGHWRNLLSEGNKIRENIERLTLELRELTEITSETDIKETENPLSDTKSDNAAKTIVEKQIQEDLTQTHQEIDNFQDENQEIPNKKETISE